MLFRIKNEKVVNYFDEIENKIGTGAFKALFPAILTDRDPCFNVFSKELFEGII